MLSYGARLEKLDYKTDFLHISSIRGTPCFVRAFDTPLAVLAAKESNDYSGSCYSTTSYRCKPVDIPR